MINLSFCSVEQICRKIKKRITYFYNQKNFDEFFKTVDLYANVSQVINLTFKDDTIEEFLHTVSKDILPQKRQDSLLEKNIVFYDQIGSATCLSLQYIRGLITCEYNILYIFESATRTCSGKILQELNDYQDSQIILVDSSCDCINKIREVYDKIFAFKPQKAILHTPAEGAFGVVVWNSLSFIRRYRVVPGDHHFYLGVNCTDIFIEFRSFGYSSAIQQRGIKKEYILINPYYPLTENSVFMGFPINVENKIVIFSSSNYYKIYGEDELYFNLLKQLLEISDNLVIFFAGDGYGKPFEKFIQKNSLQDRISLLGYRKDLNQCIANSDIYLCTYPFTGGLTTQLAAFYSKPILSYTTTDLPNNRIEGILGKPDGLVTYDNYNDFLLYASQLVLDQEFRIREGHRMKDYLISKEDFDENLMLILTANKSSFAAKELPIDYKKRSFLYLNIENKYFPRLRYILFNHYKIKSLFYFSIIMVPAFLSSLYLKFIFRIVKKKLFK